MGARVVVNYASDEAAATAAVRSAQSKGADAIEVQADIFQVGGS